jgi:hypothetical protein
MNDILAEIRLLDQDIRECTACRNDPEIERLAMMGGFKFHWEPYWHTLTGRVDFFFLAWEPSFGDVHGDEVYPQEGTFSWPLNFAIQKYLTDNYVITNMAKCSIRTGPLCTATRDFRFQTCKCFLERELQLASRCQNPILGHPRVVSIGVQPKRFIEQHAEWFAELLGGCAQLDRISHYSSTAYPHFKRFADERFSEYAQFEQATKGEYGQWLATERVGDEVADGDLLRIFKWSHEMQSLRALRGC